MKKIMIALLFFCVIMSFNFNVFAEETIPLNEVNLLNIQKLKGHLYNPQVATYVETLNLEMNQTYTIVMSYAYLLDYLSQIETLYIAFDEYDGSNGFEVYLSNDGLNQRAYVEFQTTTGMIQIHHIPVSDQSNYEIMLYRGDYQSFNGFVPYLMPSEVMSYGGVLPVDYDSLPTLEMIESLIVAKDPYGNMITKTLLTDEYSISDKLPGTYRIVYETQYNSIHKKFYLDVKIFDITKPMLSIDSPLIIPLHEKWSLSTIKSYIDVIDNVDTILSTDLIVLSDTYSTATTPGTYNVLVKAIDQSGNEETLNVIINLVDTIPPMVLGPSSIYLYTTDTPLTSTDIQNHFNISDAVDQSNVTVTLTNDEYLQTTVPGRYLVTYQAKDTQNNITTFSVYIHVVDHQGPIFEIGNEIIERTTADTMTDAEIIDWFITQTNAQGLSISNVSILYNEYEGNEEKEGDYYVYLSYVIGSEEVTSRILIAVDEEPIQNWIWIGLSVIVFTLIMTGFWFTFKHKKP